MNDYTKLTIECKEHGVQEAISTMGGTIYCKECQKNLQNPKKVTLLVPNITGLLKVPSAPQVGVAYLAGFVRSKGFDVQIIDMRLGHTIHTIEHKLVGSDFVGVYCTSFGHKKVYELISKLKSFGHKVIVGGPHASVLLGKVLRECEADLAVQGEGEFALLEILKGTDYRDIPNLIWRFGKDIIVNPRAPPIVDLDSLPYPAYDLCELDKYMDRKISFITSRGCPYHCSYCSVFYVMGNNFRPRSPEKLIEELKHWVGLGYKYFDIGDDNFSFDMDRAKKICDLIIENNLDIKFEMRNGLRVDKVDKELLTKLKAAGCQFIAYGLESTDPETQRLIKKGVSKEKALKAYEMTKDVGIGVSFFFIIGLPGDTYEKFRKNLGFALSLDLDEVRFYTAVPYPGSEFYSWVQENAKFIKEDYLDNLDMFDGKPVFETEDFSLEDRAKAFREAEVYVLTKVAKKEFGGFLGAVTYWVIRLCPFRKQLLSLGKSFVTIKRRIIK